MTNRIDYLRWRLAQVNCRVKEELRRTTSILDKNSVALVGAFHETNLGDITLRWPFEQKLKARGVSYAIQNLYRLEKYKTARRIMICGGATGVEDNIRVLFSRYGHNPANVAMCGMDFSDITAFSSDHISFLKNCAFISVRSADQLQRFRELGFTNTTFSYDNAFALPPIRREVVRRKTVGFNMLNLFMYWDGRAFRPGTALLDLYKKNNKDAESVVLQVGPQYIRLFNTLIQKLVKDGFTVEHVPFTPEDDFFARTFITAEPVTFLRYSTNPLAVMRRISGYEKFFSSRFHAAIFGFLSGTATVPFLYSKKCVDLVHDLKFASKDLPSRSELTESFASAEEKLLSHPGLTLSPDALTSYRSNASEAIDTGIGALIGERG